MSDTIFALATAPGRAGLAVVRVSGPQAGAAILALTARPVPEPRHAALRKLYDCQTETIDEALVLWFVKPASFTGEDVAEFHLHGGRAVTEAVLERLGTLPSLRPAERGEFTRRAVESGKLDLTRAEGLADLVDAETSAQRAQAFRQFNGGLYARALEWQARLVKALAWAEATIDFAEDEVPEETAAASRRMIEEILREMRALLDDNRRGEILRDGLHLTVIGPPNAGKSSLLNALARRDVAIVSPSPGTTRDIIEVRLDLDGYAVIVADTAGLRDTEELVEAEGVRRARERARAGDLTVLVLDASLPEPLEGLEPAVLGSADLVLWNKADSRIHAGNPGWNFRCDLGKALILL